MAVACGCRADAAAAEGLASAFIVAAVGTSTTGHSVKLVAGSFVCKRVKDHPRRQLVQFVAVSEPPEATITPREC